MVAEKYAVRLSSEGNCSDLWGSTGHQASHRGAAKHGICFASRLVPSNVNSYVGRSGAVAGIDPQWAAFRSGHQSGAHPAQD